MADLRTGGLEAFEARQLVELDAAYLLRRSRISNYFPGTLLEFLHLS